ncbi:universal stress protein [Georgenia sp. Z1491]|uniref:universal stress protein n=1 Tax=Georgenia sp. Z1491 TaxID=3416707 RepID=UPI003CE710AE
MTIVVGYSPTDAGRAAVDTAAAEARLRDALLVVVSVGRAGEPQGASAAAAFRDELDEARRAVAGVLDEVGRLLVDSRVEHELVPIVSSEDPSSEILRVADERSAELVVIGMRRRSPVGKLVFGSDAQRVLLGARCPVMAVHAQQH